MKKENTKSVGQGKEMEVDKKNEKQEKKIHMADCQVTPQVTDSLP